MRIDIPAGEDPILYLQHQIAAPRIRGVLQALSQTVHSNDSTISPKEREAGRYYLAYLADCNTCASFRARDLLGYSDEEMSDEWYDNIHNFKTWPGFTARERIVIEFFSRFLDDHLDVEQDDDLWARIRENFTQTEAEDLVVLCAFVAAFNMIREVMLGPTPACALEPEATMARA